MSKTKKIILIVVSSILGLLLIAGITYTAFYYHGKSKFHKSDSHIENNNVTADDDSDDVVVYGGKKYELNKNAVNILFLGVDKQNLSENLGYGRNGQADAIFVMSIDTSDKSINIIPISRETMCDVNVYSDAGNFGGTRKEQLCLAYAYGNSPAESSENVLKSVKRALYGINISSYITVDLKCIEKVVDNLGGIEITPDEDIVLEKLGTLKKGKKTTLNGKWALAYIRTRGDDISANEKRMERQNEFIKVFASKFGNALLKNPSKLSSFYNTLKPYYSTNMDFSQLTYLATNFLVGNIGNNFKYHKITGTLQKGEKWVEFIPDEKSVLENIMTVFYKEKATA